MAATRAVDLRAPALSTASEHPRKSNEPRCAVLVGPHAGGKTSLLEAMLFAAGAIPRKGNVLGRSTVGDASPEARQRQTTLEANFATCRYLDDPWTLIDAPGSVELAQEALACCMVADLVVVVVEPDPERAMALAPILKFLDQQRIPHLLFLNKMDRSATRIRDLLDALQLVAPKRLVLREVPIREGDAVTGYVDLVSERAWRFRPNQRSALIELPEQVRPREAEARQQLLEAIADYDDAILEQLLEDRAPATGEIYAQLARDLADETLVPVFFGSAEKDNGIHRLWKALRHEAPSPAQAATRLGAGNGDALFASVFKTQHQPHTGKLSVARLWNGRAGEGMSIGGRRLAGLYRAGGGEPQKVGDAGRGDVVAFARLDEVATGEALGPDGTLGPIGTWPAAAQPVHAVALGVADRKDEVKLTAALAKLIEEDPSLSLQHAEATGQMLLRGQGEIHLALAIERLKSRFHVTVNSSPPRVGYKETIRKSVRQHARHKRQTGGHGQFGDVHVEIRPLPRGEGYRFENKIAGGSIPKQYIPAVDLGVRDYLAKGPLGFPVVDVAVALTDGQYHSVDSSDQAFRTTGYMAMSEAMPGCEPVLLEPVRQVVISVPNAFTAKVHGIVSSRRGNILGLAARDGWNGWDDLSCWLPESEMADLATELRSATLGLGRYVSRFDHLAEVNGKLAERIVEERKRVAA